MLLLATFLVVIFSSPVDLQNQGELDNMAKHLDLRYDLITNLDGGGVYKARVTLTNKGTTAVTKDGDWAIYFCNIRLVVPDKNDEKHAFTFTHINGCLHKMAPTASFPGIVPDAKLEVVFHAMHWMVARTDVMPNWFIAKEGLQPRVISSTAGETLDFVGDFTTKEQWKRFTQDVYNPYTANTRYDVIGIDELQGEGDGDIVLIPQPLRVIGLDKQTRVRITADWKVYADQGLQNEVKLVQDRFKLQVLNAKPPDSRKKVIYLSTGDPDVTIDGGKSTNHEAYSLVVSAVDERVTVIGRQAAGVFYGLQTLLRLTDNNNTVAKVTIKDSPRYEYRGMHLDVARNFMSKTAVLKLLAAMATYKLNKFHFHLMDDEGWRLEIPGLEELTTVGSKRCFDMTGTKCLLTQLGSGPAEPTTGSQFYSTADYQEILRKAHALHIQVIPEFDMPGHGWAAIKAMQARYNELKNSNRIEAEKYLLNEPGDNSKYLSIQAFTDDAINPCLNTTYTFIEKLVKEVKSLHKDIQPLTVYHFGGDEVAKRAWTNSSACERLAQRNGYNFTGSDITERLKEYFVKRVGNITADRGLSLAGWEDGFLGDHDVPYDRKLFRAHDVIAYAWNNIWEWGGGHRAYLLANAGYKVVMSQATHLYFDHPSEPDPEERGYYWATRFTDTRKVFGFMPDNLYDNVENKLTGAPLSKEQFCAFKEGVCLKLNRPQNIIGMAGALWTETVRTADQMNSMIFPRLLALAERAWHKASWESISDRAERNTKRSEAWERFANFLGGQELARLDKENITYRVPPPGARLIGGKFKVRTSLPGLPVQLSRDDGKTWSDVKEDTKVDGKMKLVTWSADRTRMSRLVDFDDSTTSSGNTLGSILVTLCVGYLATCVLK